MVGNDADIKDSNLANFGTALEKQVRKSAAELEAAWHGVGCAPRLVVWRIEAFEVVPWPADKYGSFHRGDSYIVLNTYKKSDDANVLAHDLHFWIGAESTQDEYGTAAYKTVELDDYLNCAPVQHREVQGHESDLFLSYFSPRITYLAGGVASGFKHVEAGVFTPRMFHIRCLEGESNAGLVVVKQLGAVSASSLNSGDIFIIDAPSCIYQWQGRAALMAEKAKAVTVARDIANGERGGKVKVVVTDEGAEGIEFWRALGETGRVPIRSAESVQDAELQHKDAANDAVLQLWRLTDANANTKLGFTMVAQGKDVSSHALDSADVFVLDANDHVWVWVGKGASEQERRFAIPTAEKYLLNNHRPAYLAITRISEGSEPTLFKSALVGKMHKGLTARIGGMMAGVLRR